MTRKNADGTERIIENRETNLGIYVMNSVRCTAREPPSQHNCVIQVRSQCACFPMADDLGDRYIRVYA